MTDEICQSGQVFGCRVAKPGILVNRPKIQLLCEDCRCNRIVRASNGLILDGSDPSNPMINVSDHAALCCNDLIVEKSCKCGQMGRQGMRSAHLQEHLKALSCEESGERDINNYESLGGDPPPISNDCVVQLDEHSCCLCGVSMPKVNILNLRIIEGGQTGQQDSEIHFRDFPVLHVVVIRYAVPQLL